MKRFQGREWNGENLSTSAPSPTGEGFRGRGRGGGRGGYRGFSDEDGARGRGGRGRGGMSSLSIFDELSLTVSFLKKASEDVAMNSEALLPLKLHSQPG